jgi:hypothetical protein
MRALDDKDYEEFGALLITIAKDLRDVIWTATCQHNSFVDRKQEAYDMYRRPTFASDGIDLLGDLVDETLAIHHFSPVEERATARRTP